MFPGVSSVRSALQPQIVPHTAPVPVPAPPGAYPSAGSAASFFARWKAATAGCRAGLVSSAPPAPPAAAGRRLCRCGPHGPFRRISRGPYIHRRPCSSAPVFSYPIPLAAACWGGVFLLTSLWPIGRQLSTMLACFIRMPFGCICEFTKSSQDF